MPDFLTNREISMPSPANRAALGAWAPAWLALVAGGLLPAASAAAAEGHVSTTTPLVIPYPDVIGGPGVANNANPDHSDGGYWSHITGRAIGPADYGSSSASHGDHIGNTSLMNDSTDYWDNLIWEGTGKPGGLARTGVEPADPGAGRVCGFPQPGEWVSYAFAVDDAGVYTVLYRFSSGSGPDGAVLFHMAIDGVSSGPTRMQPDHPAYWSDPSHCVDGWWGHTYVPGTMPVGWKLKPGPHVLKASFDSWPEKPGSAIWLHYFKIFAKNVPAAQVLDSQ